MQVLSCSLGPSSGQGAGSPRLWVGPPLAPTGASRQPRNLVASRAPSKRQAAVGHDARLHQYTERVVHPTSTERPLGWGGLAGGEGGGAGGGAGLGAAVPAEPGASCQLRGKRRAGERASPPLQGWLTAGTPPSRPPRGAQIWN